METAFDNPWIRHADWWVERVADGADPDYAEVIIPLVLGRIGLAQRILDVGCGEGQVAARLAEGDRVVVGVDFSLPILRSGLGGAGRPDRVSRPDDASLRDARAVVGDAEPAEDPAPPGHAAHVERRHVLLAADGLGLPLRSSAFDAVVAVLLTDHLDDLDAAFREWARVLRPGGRLVVVANHPVCLAPGSTWIHDHIEDPPDHHFRLGRYLSRSMQPTRVSAEVCLDFHHRPLGAQVEALSAAGFVVEHLDEPRPREMLPGVAHSVEVPQLMVLTARFGDGAHR